MVDESTEDRPSPEHAARTRGRRRFILALVGGSILVGGIYFLPNLLAIYWQWRDRTLQGQTFCPFPVRGVSAQHWDQAYYAASTNSMIRDGRSLLSRDMWDPETGKKGFAPAGLVAFSSLLVDLVGGMDAYFVVASFVFPALSFLLTVLLLRMFIKQTWLVICAGLIAMFLNTWPPPWGSAALVQQLLSGDWMYMEGRRPLKEFSRITSSQTAYPYLLLTLMAILAAVRSRSWWKSAPAGCLLGGLAYTYFYHSTTMAAAFCVFLAGMALTRDWDAFKRALLIGGIATVVAVPAIVRFASVYGSSPAGESFKGLTRSPHISTTDIALLVVYAVVFVGRGRAFWLLFSTALAVQAWLNVQVVTGFTVQSYHWQTTLGNFVTIFLIAHVISRLWLLWQAKAAWARAVRCVVNTGAIALAGLGVVYAAHVHVDVARRICPALTLSSKARQAYARMDEINRSEPGPVAAASLEETFYLRIYTGVKAACPLSWGSSKSDEARRDSVLASLALLGYSSDKLAEDLVSRSAPYWQTYVKGDAGLDRETFERSLFVMRIWKGALRYKGIPGTWAGLTDGQIEWLKGQEYRRRKILTEETKAETLGKYETSLKDPLRGVREAGIRYLFVGPYCRRIAGGKVDLRPGMTEVFSNGEYQIIAIEPQAGKVGASSRQQDDRSPAGWVGLLPKRHRGKIHSRHTSPAGLDETA